MNIRTHKGKDMITEQGKELEQTVKINYPQLQPRRESRIHTHVVSQVALVQGD